MIKELILSMMITITLMGCNYQKPAKAGRHTDNSINQSSTSIKNKEIPIKGFQEDFIIVTSDYNFKKNYNGINLIDCKLLNGELKIVNRKIKFGKYKDVLMSGKYNSYGAYYPVQFDLPKNKLYISILRSDEMEESFDYNKILEYDLKSNSIREIITLSDYFSSWYYSEPNFKIYGFDTSIKSFISINLTDLKVDTLFSDSTIFEDIAYYPKGNNYLEIIAFKKDLGVIKLTINFKSKDITNTHLYTLTNFSSYNKGRVVETFKDFRSGIEELRLYSKSNIKSIPFQFKNFSTYWINDSEFIVIKDNEIQKINTNLEVIDQFKMLNIHVIDVLKNSIVISYGQITNEKLGILSFDFKELKEVKGIKPNDLELIKNK